MPTWSLTNAIAMSNHPSAKFLQIRVFGSIGWVPSAAFSLVAATRLFGGKVIDGTAIPLYCGGATALVAAYRGLERTHLRHEQGRMPGCSVPLG